MIRRTRGGVISAPKVELRIKLVATPQILPFVTEAAYAEWAGAEPRVLYGPERLEGGPPIVFPDGDLDYYGAAPLGYDFPAVTLTTLKDVVVRGKSNVLMSPEAIVRHGLLQPRDRGDPGGVLRAPRGGARRWFGRLDADRPVQRRLPARGGGLHR